MTGITTEAAIMSALAHQIEAGWTVEEYLEVERCAVCKSEYFDGQIYAMDRVSRIHNTLTVNIGGASHADLRGKSHGVFISNMRVKIEESRLYTYPDVVVACAEARFEDRRMDTLLDPTVIIEVLSPSTEAYDRGAKFAFYRRCDSLQDTVLVAQDCKRIEHFRRQSTGDWLLHAVEEDDAVLSLDSIDCCLSLADVYERVVFPDQAPRLHPTIDTNRGDEMEVDEHV